MRYKLFFYIVSTCSKTDFMRSVNKLVFQDSIDCRNDTSSCHADIAYCQPKTKLCVCYNGASTYPSCGKRVGTACDECTDLEYCDLKEGTCMCKWGGFAPDCATKDCGPYAMFLKGECKCMYGEKSDGKGCATCAKNCGNGATCEAEGMTWRKILFINLQ